MSTDCTKVNGYVQCPQTVHSVYETDLNMYRRGEIYGRENLRGKISVLRKVAEFSLPEVERRWQCGMRHPFRAMVHTMWHCKLLGAQLMQTLHFFPPTPLLHSIAYVSDPEGSMGTRVAF